MIKKKYVLLVLLLLGLVLFTACDHDKHEVTYGLIITIEGEGIVQPEEGIHEYADGTVVNLIATSGQGYKFSNWQGEVSDSESRETSILIDNNKTLKAVFIEKEENNTGEQASTHKYFEFDSDIGTITDYDIVGGGDVVIPSKINGIEVKKIGILAFYYKSLTSVVLPDSLTTIAAMAFCGNSLKTIEIPDGVTTIAAQAFLGNELTSVVLPDSITTIAAVAFSGNELTSVEIPSSVTTIGDFAFSNNNLTSVKIPDSVTTINRGAFSGNELTSVVLPDSVTTIGDFAFSNNNLTSVKIPDSVTTIGDYAFDYDVKLYGWDD